jgi:hypothetical protein
MSGTPQEVIGDTERTHPFIVVEKMSRLVPALRTPGQ